MELKVWVEGIQRVVCGVSDTTTCQDVVYALAHATGKTGRFTLIEKWRNSERLLAPSEFPRKILFKWGEYSPDVQFILQRTAIEPKVEEKSPKDVSSPGSSSTSSSEIPKTSIQKQAGQSGATNKDIKKSLTFSGAHAGQSLVTKNDNPGEVGFHGAHKEFHAMPSDDASFPVKPNIRLPYHMRPLAPPPYEVVKGIPPPPIPSHQPLPPTYYKPATRANDVNSLPVRVPPPYSRASQFSRVRLPQPQINHIPRGLPPYRDPPPPPIPSHPALLKLTNQSYPQGNPDIINYQVSSIYTHAENRQHLKNDKPPTVKPHEALDGNRYNTSNNISHKTQAISTSIHHPKLKQILSSSFVNNEHGSPSNDISSEYCQPLPQSFKSKIKSTNNVESFAKTKKLDKLSHSDGSHVQKCPSKLNGYAEGHKSDVKLADGDINDNVLTSQAVTVAGKQNGKDGDFQIKEMFEELSRRDFIDHSNGLDGQVEKVVVDAYYKSLVKLVNMQRDKICSQQVDLTKYEAEIAYMDGRWKEDESRLNYLQSEVQQIEKTTQFDSNLESIEKLESELEKSQTAERSMTALLTEMQDKYSSCQNKLAQVEQKASALEKQLNMYLEKQKKVMEVENEEEELAILREIEKLQMVVMQANKQVQISEEISNLLADEISDLEAMLDAKRSEVDQLRQSMKEANLEALTMTPPDESKQSPEGSWKSGTNRVMKGSPRQLETAVPTSKNPHGVWV